MRNPVENMYKWEPVGFRVKCLVYFVSRTDFVIYELCREAAPVPNVRHSTAQPVTITSQLQPANSLKQQSEILKKCLWYTCVSTLFSGKIWLMEKGVRKMWNFPGLWTEYFWSDNENNNDESLTVGLIVTVEVFTVFILYRKTSVIMASGQQNSTLSAKKILSVVFVSPF